METLMPRPELIVMLTHHDLTVSNALELFTRLKDQPVTHWGFKDVGLPPEQMHQVVAAMKTAGKTTYLEVVSLSEAEGLRGAKLAVELGFDILMGTVYFPSIKDYLHDKAIRYYPFPGRIHSHPSILDGTIDEIVATLDSSDWGECDPNLGAQQPSCHLTTGMFADLFGRLAGAPVAVLEVECRSAGHQRCRFLVGSPDVMDAVYDEMGRGADYDAAVRSQRES